MSSNAPPPRNAPAATADSPAPPRADYRPTDHPVMSPFLKRLAGFLGRAPQSSDPPSITSEPEQRRRRRGGRGRGSSNGSAPIPDPPSNQRPAPVARPQPQPSRPYGNSSYDRRRPQRRNLDQPLPEDIAFRPPAEGGDRSILPSRRRPPPGLKATKRVLLSFTRFVPRNGAVEDDGAAVYAPRGPQALGEPREAARPAEGDGAALGEATAERSGKRRRGRRGGRGRRRGGADAAPAGDS